MILIFFVLYMGLLIFVAHFWMSPYIFLHQANQICWGLLLSPIPSVRLLIFEKQLFILAAFVWSRCPQSSHSYRTYRCVVCVVCSFLAFWDNGIWNFLTKTLLTSFWLRNFRLGYIWNIGSYQLWDTSGLILQLQLSIKS